MIGATGAQLNQYVVQKAYAMFVKKDKIMEKVKRIQELRRSNAATAIPSKKKYTRKNKYKNKFDNQLIFGRQI